jgi:hypothetical protein
VLKDVAAWLTLYRRCKGFNRLPKDGGILDQDENTMVMLDHIDSIVENLKSKRIEDQKGDMEKDQMLRNLKHG